MTPQDHESDWQDWAKQEADHLSKAMERMNEVIQRQLTALSPTHGAARAVDIRRRQTIRYPQQHDAKHGGRPLVQAAQALIDVNPDIYPWSREQAQKLMNDPDRLLHAAALLMAAYDAGMR